MPFIFIVPVWILCIAIGFGMLLFTHLRHLCAYLIAGSTFGLIVSFLLSTAVLLIFPRFDDSIGLHDAGLLGGVVLIGGYIAGIAIGGALGLVAGAVLARKF